MAGEARPSSLGRAVLTTSLPHPSLVLLSPPHLGHLLKPGLHVRQLELGLLKFCLQLLVLGQGALVELGRERGVRSPPSGQLGTGLLLLGPNTKVTLPSVTLLSRAGDRADATLRRGAELRLHTEEAGRWGRPCTCARLGQVLPNKTNVLGTKKLFLAPHAQEWFRAGPLSWVLFCKK